MKCEYCGGAIIIDPGCYPEGPSRKCINCGRRVDDPGDSKEKKIMEEKKICIKCRKEFPKTEEFFRKNSKTRDGFEGQCKNCRKKYFVDYRAGKRVRSKSNKAAPHPGRKPKLVRHSDPAAPAPVISASPAEIVIALRKGMAAEIVAMISEKYGL